MRILEDHINYYALYSTKHTCILINILACYLKLICTIKCHINYYEILKFTKTLCTLADHINYQKL